MRWIDTDFGLYALCPDAYVADWEGTEADAVAADSVGMVSLTGHGDVLTLGGEPLPVAYLQNVRTFVRWVAADDDHGLEEAVEAAGGSSDWQDLFEIALDGRYTLLDSAMSGSEVEDSEIIRIDLPKGNYLVQSLTVSPDDESEFQLERLVSV
ncbi:MULTISPECIES: Imm21 family immunity protein [unclassified Streptomyces]|uniref:Imm21 family immunity protein n=1 Tax=unclassified Streptomyces TaxID=2593676 RepID=UPI0013E3FCDD|nr:MULTISPECIES: Imm21 family immunity protein [unclassified Streptomyces]UQA35621.1 immunity 21 family protein [Streptomyces sp. HNA39]